MKITKYDGRDNEGKEWFLMHYTEIGVINFHERQPNFITSTIFLDNLIGNAFYIYHFNNRLHVSYNTNLLDDIEAEEVKAIITKEKITFISCKRQIEFNRQ